MDVRFRPYIWVGPQTPAFKRRNAPFNSSWTQTLNKIEYELERLKATEILIEAGFSDSQIRLDGWPKANQNPSHPGIKISFNQPGVGRVEYPCDSCRHWQDNVHSIALGLQALRAVERYGITARMQQYTGFRAIDGPSNGTDFRTKREAAAWLAVQISHREPAEITDRIMATLLASDAEAKKKFVRVASLQLHPDHNHGDDSLWRKFEAAKERLGL